MFASSGRSPSSSVSSRSASPPKSAKQIARNLELLKARKAAAARLKDIQNSVYGLPRGRSNTPQNPRSSSSVEPIITAKLNKRSISPPNPRVVSAAPSAAPSDPKPTGVRFNSSANVPVNNNTRKSRRQTPQNLTAEEAQRASNLVASRRNPNYSKSSVNKAKKNSSILKEKFGNSWVNAQVVINSSPSVSKQFYEFITYRNKELSDLKKVFPGGIPHEFYSTLDLPPDLIAEIKRRLRSV